MNRQQRGQPTPKEVASLSKFHLSELIKLLNNSDAATRSAAAIILGKRKNADAVKPLCRQLQKEKALYAKINICNALAEIGEPAVPELVSLLGKIGKTQHKSVEYKGFYKFSYPLPRDICARTLMKIGVPALKYLQKVINEASRTVASEAIDAVGHISFYSKDTSSVNVLLKALDVYKEDELIVWKIVRSFQAFNMPETNMVLYSIINGELYPLLKYEAVRSLALNRVKIPENIKTQLLDSEDAEIKRLINKFLIR